MRSPRAAPLPRGEPTLLPHRADPRFSYWLYLPRRDAPGPLGVVVSVHDTRRLPLEYVTGLVDFCEAHHHVALAPLFPASTELGGDDGYKILQAGGLRFDLLLNAMLDEVAANVPCDTERILLHGYSGGAQFAHRYLLVHPHRVRAMSIGAPGSVTLIDDQQAWWAGVGDMPARFGHGLDIHALRRVPVQLVVGEQDTALHGIKEQPPSRWWPNDTSRRNANRIHRLQTLRRALEAAGVTAQFVLLPGTDHGQGQVPSLALAARFFASQLPAAKGG